MVIQLHLQASGIPPEERGPRVERLREAAAATPGVRSASVSGVRLLRGGGWFSNSVGVNDDPMTPEDRRNTGRVWRNATTPGWFDTMSIPLVSGRDFDGRDRVSGPLVAVVNETFVRRFVPSGRPIGQTVRVTDGGPRYEIVGVVADAVYTTPREGMLATMYVPLSQREPRGWTSWEDAVLTVDTGPGQRAAVERDVARALTRVDPTVVFTSGTFDQAVDATMIEERLVAMMSGFFGALALLLAGLGLYGVVTQTVRARRTEIGLRIALGAAPSSVLGLVFRRVGALIGVGLALGVVGSLWAARFVETLLFQLEARDPVTFAGAAAVLVAVGVLAAWMPARRVAHIDPVAALRTD